MPLRATWRTIKQNVPTPAWMRWPERQRFCGCCSIRTGASVIGWFDFIFNSLYVGMMVLAMTELRNLLDEMMKSPPEFTDMTNNPIEYSGDVAVPTHSDGDLTATVMHPALSPDKREFLKTMIHYTLPLTYASICIPGVMIAFSILWLITVEARDIRFVRLFGRAFILAIIVQIISQLGFLIYIEIKSREASNGGVGWIAWSIFVVYSLLNVYFIPVLSEYIRRRIRESDQGMDQGLLTAEMYPRARVAEEYIQDAFTVEADVDMVQFQASLVKPDAKVENNENETRVVDNEYSPI